MKIGHTDTLFGHPVQVGGIDLAPIRREIAVAQVIGHDDENVWLPGCHCATLY
jgi:hypothetical protein